jgi:hypothetical protein
MGMAVVNADLLSKLQLYAPWGANVPHHAVEHDEEPVRVHSLSAVGNSTRLLMPGAG